LELKKAREELEAQNEVLQENVRLREEVEAINRHDLKNPLMIVMTVPQAILADSQLTEGQQKLLRMVDEAGRRMLEMINRTIDLYKMERGNYTLKPAGVDVIPIVTQTTTALGSLMRAASLTCVVTVNGRDVTLGDHLKVWGEDLLVYSLLANLLKNAAEASPEGQRISVSLREGELATIEIHNMGAIPKSIRPRFFQEFPTAGKKGGTGLGAYSAMLIANTLNGSIGFETSETSGTTVTVKLPRA
jgi:signal transduction histidine kinase